MKKVLIREGIIYALTLILLAISMHSDLLTNPTERYSLLSQQGNFYHPFIYAFIIYLLIFILLFFIKKIVLLINKVSKNR